ncbi:hypothetical protein KI688_005182 [Linnemannia hyalina]|uniref:Aminopeptidase n=1 Tax=Linnemannia hyalina TaxID=64524 RepID=A0A9P8BP22_9FUNG|nr:hypothetical protein KI688_005182 [Linnemannia hyalina]
MATYLLAWMIGDLEYIEAYTPGDFSGEPVCCRLYAPIGLATHGQYSLDLAVKSVEYFSRLFDIPYPLPKLDLVAVPDFSPGAMENWGLITFRTHAVLLDEHSTNDRQREIAATVIHEISHQWFGNLVTMDWWSDLWLFEGFATHLAYIVVDELFPAWDVWSEFVTRVQHVLKQDALRTSHPVEVGVANPGEITQIFDEVSYMKGAAVLRMLSGWLGEEQLLKGIRKFMMRYMWGNANTDDLWMTLAEECQADVPEFMRRWTRQTGIDESTIMVRQSLFLSTGDIREDEDDFIWPVPLALATAEDPTPKNIMMTTKELILKVDTTRWYKFNMGQSGFYRVSYPPRALDLLGQTLKNGEETETLKTADRVGLLTDAAALVAAGVSPTSSFLTLLKYFEDEENNLVWTEISLRLQELVAVWLEQPAPVVNAIKEVQRRLFKNIVKRLGWTYPEGEDPAIGNLRALAIRFAGRAADPEDTSAIPPDLLFPVFEIVLKTTTGLEEYEAILAFYRETYSPGEKVVALTVLGYGNSPEMIQRTLAFAMSEEVRNADILSALATLRSSVMGRAELWNFMRQHWDVLYERHFDDLRFVEYFILFSIGMFSSVEKYQEVQDFFANKDTSQCDRILANCLEGIRTRILWLERDREDVEVWLKTNGYLVTTAHDEVGVGESGGGGSGMKAIAAEEDGQYSHYPFSRRTSSLHVRHDLQLSLALLGRSRSGSSVDDGLSPATNDTHHSVPSATSSCSSSPPAVYLEHPEHQHLNHLYHTHEHQHHHHHHHQHHEHGQEHRHQQQHHEQIQHSSYQQQEQHSRSQVYLDESTARLIDERFQLSQQQEQQQKDGAIMPETTTAAPGMAMNDLMAVSVAANVATAAAAAAVTGVVPPRAVTLEGEMEMLRLGGEGDY